MGRDTGPREGEGTGSVTGGCRVGEVQVRVAGIPVVVPGVPEVGVGPTTTPPVTAPGVPSPISVGTTGGTGEKLRTGRRRSSDRSQSRDYHSGDTDVGLGATG